MSRETRRVRAAMSRDGFAVVDGLFPRALLERLRRDVLRRHESGQLRRRGLVRDIAGRYTAVLPFEGPFLDPRFYASPRVLALMESLLGSTARIGSLETVIALPGAYDQHLHMDGPLRLDRLEGGRKRGYARDLSDLPPYAVTLCVPLCEVGEENGPTELYAGSHREALKPRPPSEASVMRRYRARRMTGPLGRCFLFDFRVYHRGTPNLTPDPRPVLMFVWLRSWFRDPNQHDTWPGLVIRDRDLRRMPARRRELFALAPAARRRLWA